MISSLNTCRLLSWLQNYYFNNIQTKNVFENRKEFSQEYFQPDNDRKIGILIKLIMALR